MEGSPYTWYWGAGKMDGGKACVLGVEENIAKEILFEQFGLGVGVGHVTCSLLHG